MYYRIIVILFFISFKSYSQLTYRFVDSITYSQLINGQYEDLIDTAESALYEEIDFYYLRIRLGIAYYSVDDKESALPHFAKANAMNPADTICQEYLYYSYVFSGREDDARLFVSKLSIDMQKKLGYKKKIIESISICGGYGYTDNMVEGKTKEISGNRFIYGQAMYQGPFYFTCGVIEQRISQRLKILYGMWYYNTKSMGAVQGEKRFITQDYTHAHFQYNLAGTYYAKNKIDFSLAGSFYVQNSSVFFGQFNSKTNRYDFYTSSTRYDSYAIVAGIGKRFGKFHPSVNIANANFIDRNQYQAEAGLMFYPFGNNKLYTVTNVAYQNDDGENRVVFFQKLGVRLTKKLWVEENFSVGNHLNYISKYAFLTYNTLEPVKIILGLDFKYYFRHLEINIGYRLQQLEGSYFYNDTPTEINTKNFNYINHLTTTTLKWNF